MAENEVKVENEVKEQKGLSMAAMIQNARNASINGKTA